MTRHLIHLIWNRKRLNLLLSFEILLSFLVLFAVALPGLHYAADWQRPLGFDIDRVWRVEVRYPRNAPGAAANAGAVFREIVAALRSLPDVEEVAGATMLPYDGSSSRSGFPLSDGRNISVRLSHGTDELRDVLDIRLIAGRWFSAEDDAGTWTPVVMNQRLAREIFGDESPVGQRVALAERPTAPNLPATLRIIGVMEDFRQDGEFSAPENYMFFRIRPGGGESVTPSLGEQGVPSALAIRVAQGTTAAFEETLITHLLAVAGDWTFRIRPIEEERAQAINASLRPVIVAGVVASFLLAMVALGLTGVVWQSVTRRTQEFGLRRANGATVADVRRQVLMELLLLASVAVVVGVALVIQLPVVPLPSAGFTPRTDVWVASIAVSTSVIYLLTLLCAWYPSRLATRIQPAEALHYE